MFDPGLLMALDQVPYSLPPQPVIPIEEVLRSPRAAYAEQHIAAMLGASQGQFRQWRAGMDGLISQLWDQGSQQWDAAARTSLDQTIGMLEKLAERRARATARQEKRSRALNRRLPADLAYSHRTTLKSVLGVEQEKLEALLDFAMQFRALRSSIAPGAGKGRVFDNGVDLAAYLDAALHA